MTIFFYSPDTDLKAETLTLWNSHVLLPTWYQADGWYLNGSALADTTLSGVAGSGFAASFPGSGTDAWAIQENGSFVHLLADQTKTLFAAPSGAIFAGGCLVSGSPYAVDAAHGTVYTVSGTGVVAVTPSFGSTPAKFLAVSGSTLYTLLPSVSGVGTLVLSTATSGTSGVIAASMNTVAALAVSGTNIAVGGWNNVSYASGYAGLAMEPVTGIELLGVRTGALDIYATSGQSIWSLAQTVTGLGTGTSVTWSPDDRFAFTAEPSSGVVRVFTNTVGVLALSQTLSAVGAVNVAITTDGLNGLVACTASNLLQGISVTGSTWSLGTTVSLTGAKPVLPLSATSVAAGYASGVAYLGLVVSTWSVTASAGLGFQPNALAVDENNVIYAVGTSGASGVIAAVSGTTVLSSGSWAGNGAGVYYEQGRIVVIDGVNSSAYTYGLNANVLALESTRSAPSGVQSIAGSGADIFMGGTSAMNQYTWGNPYDLQSQHTGQVSVYNGSAWANFVMGVSGIPAAITWSPSGHVTIATRQNNRVTITSSAAFFSSGVIAQAAGQSQTVPLGISSLLWVGGVLYAATGMNDALILVNS